MKIDFICSECGSDKVMAKPTDWSMPFGQYRGKTLEMIKKLDPTYLQWLWTNNIFNDYFARERLREIIEPLP